ncbi:TetR/AcrR family transcriptional regulator [Octadecabacter sp. G9-8]|uniref:TetR/AcrR family transcriptional regulator n=1 Tax=Octadecabacter dasysiphoniae TaxID=2909341 RepID=A0ABS9CVK4_9RHOB|nr:TetR/AcrR family transcriptional regulator [Octadecabacter dasysiphoniae]MCF2870864.1 TetR/AcrR family transcriptional regulator [Octadecabacter dasysiphoniae]
MAGKVQARRAALRDALIQHAEQRIETDGLKNLRARDLAKDAGCALGAIYNVFGDLNDLVLAVNARSFHALGAQVAEALADAPQDATEQLIVMSHAYHRFAAENFNTWRALFDIERPAGQAAPDWYLQEMGQLFAYIDAPLSVLFPDHDAEKRALLTKALFSSVHGIVLLGLDEASAGVPAAQLDEMISLILSHLAS